MKMSSYIAAHGLTLTEMAVRLGLPVQTVSRYASGARRPREAEMVRIYEVTGGQVTPNDFFDLPGQPPPPGASGPASHAAE